MKLRYYLRGLGIGMLVAALVLILSGSTGGEMSDEAVKRRAAQLGMVEKDKSVLGDMKDESAGADSEGMEPEQSGVEEGVISEGEEAVGQAEAVNPEQGDGLDTTKENEAELGEQEGEEAPALTEEQTLAQEIEQRADEVAERGKEVAENSVPMDIVTFTVQQGDTSISVARRAQEMGLVESAADFDVFLCQNGYSKRIAIGSYEITVGATQKEIADILTKSR